MSNLTPTTTAIPTNRMPVSSLGADAWCSRDLAGHRSIPTQQSVHNCMKPTGAAPVNAFDAGRRVYAAEQAAPPRGRYR